MDKSEGEKRGGVPVVSEHLEIYTRERVIVEDMQAHQGRASSVHATVHTRTPGEVH